MSQKPVTYKLNTVHTPSPTPNAFSCLLMSLLRTRHLKPIGNTLLSTCALCNLHITVTLKLLYRRLKLT